VIKQASGSLILSRLFKSTLSTKCTGKSLHFLLFTSYSHTACVLCNGNLPDKSHSVLVNVYELCPATTFIVFISNQYQLSEFLMSAQKSSITKFRNLYASSVVTISSVHPVCLLANDIISDGFIKICLDIKP
jgi:hypothetical protein